MPEFPLQLQIVDKQGVLVRTFAGGRHEADLVETCVTNIMARGVGFWRTAAHVEQDIRDGIVAAIRGIKVTNPYDIQED